MHIVQSAVLSAWTLLYLPAAAGAIDVRVGIVAYEDFEGELERFRGLLAELSERDPDLSFRVAVGTYGDAVHWLDHQLVDVAVLTPGVFAELFPEDGGAPRGCVYLATMTLPPATSPWASPARRGAEEATSYASVCLVAESSPLRTADDLLRAAARDEVEYLFVDPLSASGRRAAEKALGALGVELNPERVHYTYSHSESLRLLRNSAQTRTRVAFVWDDAAGADPQRGAGIRRLEFRELDRLSIPHDVVVCRADFAEAERVQQALLEARDATGRAPFVLLDDWRDRYTAVRAWAAASDFVLTRGEGQPVSLDEIGRLLVHATRAQPRPPRIALVLSGGGAKCSYQVGVVRALEEQFAALRTANPDLDLDLDLVVGTSGGAINALPVALGITRTPQGAEDFGQAWQRLDQREIVRPARIVGMNIGLWMALVQAGIVGAVVRRTTTGSARKWRWLAGTCVALAAAELLVGYVRLSPWDWLGMNHSLHHAWLWLSFGLRTCAWMLLAVAVAVWLAQRFPTARGPFLPSARRARVVLLAGLLGLPLLQLITVLFWSPTLSRADGMQRALADNYAALVDRELERRQMPGLALGDVASDRARLGRISGHILSQGLLRRDPVITRSCLEQTSRDLPSDLYFYAAADRAGDPPGFGDRGIALDRSPEILLDVILGSGSIFPIFPARTIEDMPRYGETIRLVDGGFAHNSPIEAAVQWGATHVFLIEASAPRQPASKNLTQNVAASFAHLHRQAQLLDARTRGEVTVFSLRPAPPHVCVLDFASNLVRASIERGYADAALPASSGIPRFRKEPGAPLFSEVGPGSRPAPGR